MDGGANVSVGTEGLDASIQHLGDLRMERAGASHRFAGKDRRTRFCTARAYSRQTS